MNKRVNAPSRATPTVRYEVKKTKAGQWRWGVLVDDVEMVGGAGYDTEEAATEDASAEAAHQAERYAHQGD